MIRRSPYLVAESRALDSVIGVWMRQDTPRVDTWEMVCLDGVTRITLEPTELIETRLDGRCARVAHITTVDESSGSRPEEKTEATLGGFCPACCEPVEGVVHDLANFSKTYEPCECTCSILYAHVRRQLGLSIVPMLSLSPEEGYGDEVHFPVKLSEDYPCQGIDSDGVAVVFDDLLEEGDTVARYSDHNGNMWGPTGTVVRRQDGLWIDVLEVKSPA